MGLGGTSGPAALEATDLVCGGSRCAEKQGRRMECGHCQGRPHLLVLGPHAALPPGGCRPPAFYNGPPFCLADSCLLPGESSLRCDYHLEPSGQWTRPFLETKKLRLKRWQMLFTKPGCCSSTCLNAHSYSPQHGATPLGLRGRVPKVCSVEPGLRQ